MRTNSIKYLSIYEDLKEEIINGTYPIGGLFDMLFSSLLMKGTCSEFMV